LSGAVSFGCAYNSGGQDNVIDKTCVRSLSFMGRLEEFFNLTLAKKAGILLLKQNFNLVYSVMF